MRINPVVKKRDARFDDLPPIQKGARKVAIVVAFIGIYIWFFKIVF